MSLASAAAWAATATQGLPWVWAALGLAGIAVLIVIVVRGRRGRRVRE
jgi:Flp pilus assembly protein TadB